MKKLLVLLSILIATTAMAQMPEKWQRNTVKGLPISGEIQDVSVGKHHDLVAMMGKWRIMIFDRKHHHYFAPYYRHDGDMQGSARFSPDGRYVAYYGLEPIEARGNDWNSIATDIYVARTSDGSLVNVLSLRKYEQAPVMNNIVWKGNTILLSATTEHLLAWYPTRAGTVMKRVR